MVKKKCCHKIDKKGTCCSSCPLSDLEKESKIKKSKKKDKKKKGKKKSKK